MADSTSIMLLTWLHNIYLGKCKNLYLNKGSKFIAELHEAGLILFKNPADWSKPVITSKGKKVLIQNLHLITPE